MFPYVLSRDEFVWVNLRIHYADFDKMIIVEKELGTNAKRARSQPHELVLFAFSEYLEVYAELICYTSISWAEKSFL